MKIVSNKRWKGKQMKKIYGRILIGMLMMILAGSVWMGESVYAANLDRQINGRGEGENIVDGEADMGVDINLQKDSEASSENQNASSQATSTNDVGKGINDQLSKNAKTGDVFSGRNIVILFAATGILLVVLGFQRKRGKEV